MVWRHQGECSGVAEAKHRLLENLWLDWKAVYTQPARNLTELEQVCEEEWSKFAASRCESLIGTRYVTLCLMLCIVI